MSEAHGPTTQEHFAPTPARARRAVRAAAAGAVLALALGCSPSLLDLPESGPPPARYELLATAASSDCSERTEGPLVIVERPSIRDALSSDRIAIRLPNGELRSLAGARWASPLPAMLQHVLIEALASACLQATADPLGLGSVYRLSTEVVRFQASGGPDGLREVEVGLRARLLAEDPLRLLDQRRFARTVAIAQKEVDAVVAAFDRAVGELSAPLARWAEETIRAREESNPTQEPTQQEPTP